MVKYSEHAGKEKRIQELQRRKGEEQTQTRAKTTKRATREEKAQKANMHVELCAVSVVMTAMSQNK